ncbi:MAG: exodeoxyribonuclease VII small subunit [Halomonas sp.]|uniref:exodeoxyribonuclease VII small subunit n=1 Tax=unclassified Halomonas TaxID=2609666 RepID=UPI00099094CA|nr:MULTISPECIES: exodeoxyribonuclease VII small subunit [unclassified Halomonas]AQU84249.1 exodeoxyribonuclease VII small subunit [Halomonas sp. 'Soap Lake \
MSEHIPPAQDFAATVSQLETLVERLESGDLSLEDALTAFEQGVRLTRDAQQRLDAAELKVRALSEDRDGRLKVAPFATTPDNAQENGDDSEETPPW